MAFTQTELTALEQAYARGVRSVTHNGKTVTYDSMDALWDAIQRMRRALAPASKRFVSGHIGYRKY